MSVQNAMFTSFPQSQGLRFLLKTTVLLALSACAATEEIAKLPSLPTTVTPVAPAADTLGPYHLQVGDVLDLKFPLNPELNESVTVRPDGMISTSVAEDVPAYNLTVASSLSLARP